MKAYPLKVLLAAIAVDSGSCFVPASLRHTTVATHRAQGPLFSSNMGDVSLDSTSVVSAYEEWRKKFGKGDFDPARFPNFENNFKVLTTANIRARDKAVAEGRSPPQWLDLNEFGDYSREEYEAMKKAKQAATPTAESSSIGTRPIRSTQKISPPKSWGTQVIEKNDPNGGSPVRGTQVISKAPADQPASGSPMRGTQVISKAPADQPASASPMRGTQVISRAPADQPASEPSTPYWGNQPIQGTRKVTRDPNEPSPRGTQVIRKASDEPPVTGTQVIQKVAEQPPARPTQVVRPAGSQPAPTGTQPIQGTQVIQRNEYKGQGSETTGGSDEASRGTYVVGSSSGQAPRGTIVIPRGEKRSSSETGRGTVVIRKAGPPNGSSNDPPEPAEATSGRGTMVIKRNSAETSDGNNPLSDFFGEGGTGTRVLRRVTDRASSSIFSFFGGTKMVEDPSRAVRGTVVLQGGNASAGGGEPKDGRPQTVLVDKADVQQTTPSIFSFFGGTKTEEPDTEQQEEKTAVPEQVKPKLPARPTLVIDKNSLEFPRSKDLPELRRWWQNADGSITGFIYKSSNFNDGTKLTTSPLQRAASKPGNVVRSGGEDYLLK